MHRRGADRRKSFLQVSREALGLVERRRQSDRRRQGYISRLQLFASIPYEAIETALAECITREVAAGTCLLEPGEPNDSIHLLVAGRLRIHLDRIDSADFMTIEEGGCVGELSIIDGRPVSAYVVADAPSTVLTIHEKVFWEHLIPQAGVARNLLNVLSERMRLNRDIIIERMKDKLALEHLQKEMSIATSIQMSMLPPGARLFPDRSDVQAYAIMEPAKNVGGDFYDAFFAAPTRLFVAVGDVSGKGVPAALFMARTITQLRMEAVRRRSPAAILEAVNRRLCEGNEDGMFVTLFCGMLDTASGQFCFANAGHNPPLFLGLDGGAEFMKIKKGILAGIMEEARYGEQTRKLAPGECVLLYTDGVTEAMNARDEAYSEEALLDAARAAHGLDPHGIVDSIRGSIAGFVQNAPAADDITMLALRYCCSTPDVAPASASSKA